MMRNLIEEVRNRRVLALAALGVLVALALPLLFLKGAPDGAPSADTAAPPAATEAKLPPRAARLLATTDQGTPGRASGSTADPFAPPAAYRAAAADKGGGGATEAKASTPAAAATAGGAAGSITTAPIPAAAKRPAASTKGKSTKRSTALTSRNAAVDIRFGAKADTKIRRAISRQKGFYIHGKLVAMFVKYSPARKAAVFALAPGLHVSGPVKCRVIAGSCRYLDIPAGEHAWVTLITDKRIVVARRLDVVHVKRRSAGSTATRSASARSEASCLLGKLVKMQRGDALLDRDACQRS
jgi:hypothetical protein